MTEHKADRELDALIAEKVMGWTRVNYSIKDEEELYAWFDENNCNVAFESWSPSTQIADAWLIVDKMIGEIEYIGPDEFRGSIFHMHNKWFTGFGPLSTNVGKGCDSAPHAICLAALKSVGVDDE